MAGILSVVKLPQLNALKTEALSTEYLLSPALEKYCLLMAVVLAVVHCSMHPLLKLQSTTIGKGL